jgi:hypothetical protein
MADITEIGPNNTIPPLPPLPGAAPLVHIPGTGDGKNWPLASAGIAATAVATRPTVCILIPANLSNLPDGGVCNG